MGYQTIIHGKITGDRFNWGGNTNLNNDSHLYHKLNRMVIEQLPEKDEWPKLTKQMFNLPALSLDDGVYKNQVIVFGASYKELELSWNEWLIKFETLLTKLYWKDAVIYVESELRGNRTYRWENKNEPPFIANLNNTQKNWEIKGDDLFEFIDNKN